MAKKIKAGSKSDHPSIFYDYFATVCDIIGAKLDFKIDGKSYLNVLIGEEQKNMTIYIGVSSYIQQAIRVDEWKVIRNYYLKAPLSLNYLISKMTQRN